MKIHIEGNIIVEQHRVSVDIDIDPEDVDEIRELLKNNTPIENILDDERFFKYADDWADQVNDQLPIEVDWEAATIQEDEEEDK